MRPRAPSSWVRPTSRFCACPTTRRARAVAMVAGGDTRVIDASTAHRVADGWTYGFAEMDRGQRAAIRDARYVANPGCWPQGPTRVSAPAGSRRPAAGRLSRHRQRHIGLYRRRPLDDRGLCRQRRGGAGISALRAGAEAQARAGAEALRAAHRRSADAAGRRQFCARHGHRGAAPARPSHAGSDGTRVARRDRRPLCRDRRIRWWR